MFKRERKKSLLLVLKDANNMDDGYDGSITVPIFLAGRVLGTKVH